MGSILGRNSERLPVAKPDDFFSDRNILGRNSERLPVAKPTGPTGLLSRQGQQSYGSAKELMKMRGATKDHWDTIQQWRIDEGKNFAKSRANAITRMGASGLKPGTDMWKANLATIDAENAKNKAENAGSATQGILDRWSDTMKQFYVDATKFDTVKAFAGRNNDSQYKQISTAEGQALAGQGGINPFSDSGLSEADFLNLSTDEFMTLSFGVSEDAATQNALDEEAAIAQASDRTRQAAAASQVQEASPWWA